MKDPEEIQENNEGSLEQDLYNYRTHDETKNDGKINLWHD
jgi:hypothetical protein